MSFNDFIKPELIIMIPVMYLIGIAVKKSPIRDFLIPFILGGVSILIATLYVLASTAITGWQDGLMALFVAVTQGILAAGTSVYANQLFKQGTSYKDAAAYCSHFDPPAADPLIIVDVVKSGNKVRDGQVHAKDKIIIHDTGNYKADADALAHASYLKNMVVLNNTYISWHYTVDADRIIQHIPDNEIAWHAGDGTKESGGNMSGIGIEMCINDMSRFDQVLRNTAWLVAGLMERYGWTVNAIKQHFDCSGKNCPYEVRRVSGKWQGFLDMSQEEYTKRVSPSAPEQYNRVQVGAWNDKALAEAYAAKLRKARIDGNLVACVLRFYEGFWRVQVGAWSYASMAQAFANKLEQVKIDGKNIQTTVKFY